MTMSLSQQMKEALERIKAVRKVKHLTPQRQAILEHLLTTRDHPTAEGIYHVLVNRIPGMSIATVYNNLRFFIEVGLVRELTYGGAPSRFESTLAGEHGHVICRQCHKIVDLHYPDTAALDSLTEEATGFTIDSHRLDLFGLCEACRG